MDISTLRQILAAEGFRIAADPLAALVKGALKKGQFIGDPKIGSYTVTPEGIVVDVTVSVVVPPSKALAAAPPKEALKMVFSRPELLANVPDATLKNLPFKALKPAQFKSFVKKMGGLGQYSDEVLRALLEGRKAEIYEPAGVWYEGSPAFLASLIGGATADLEDWGGGEQANIAIKGGILTGTGEIPFEWRNPRGLTIKQDIEAPYIEMDGKIHGYVEGESKHPSLQRAEWMGPASRVEELPKGTPGITRVSSMIDLPLVPTPLADMSRGDLEDLVKDVAEA